MIWYCLGIAGSRNGVCTVEKRFESEKYKAFCAGKRIAAIKTFKLFCLTCKRGVMGEKLLSYVLNVTNGCKTDALEYESA